MRFRDYCFALALALLVVVVALGIESVVAVPAELPVHQAAAAATELPGDMPEPLPMPPPASMTLVFEAPCADAAAMLTVHAEMFGQVSTGAGIVDDGTEILLLVSPEGVWSIVAVTGGGDLACGVASGGGWRSK
ncbi:MAG: hypothetical protein WD928_05085 [Gammaproteobacteria bacterium]